MTQDPYDREFFERHDAGARRSARVLVPLVLGLVPARSVIDVGCGQGTWLSVFRESGIDDVFGIDGAYVDRTALRIAPDHFESRDLAQPFALPRTFDLAVSLEVAEHLPAAAAEGFIASLARLAPVVLFSAAAPHQGGQHHVNEQWPDYWAARFAAHGFVPVDCLRRAVWQNADVEWWYAQNAFLYVRRDRLDADAVLRRQAEIAGPGALPLVHPRRYLEWVEWGLAQCAAQPSAPARTGEPQ